MTFASRSLREHLARGVIAAASMTGAVVLVADHPWVSALLVPIVLLALRGCPMCWVIGLIQTWRGRAARCPDGRCGAGPHDGARPPSRA